MNGLFRFDQKSGMPWFYFATAIYGAMICVILIAKTQQRSHSNWVTHTYEVIDQINDIEVSLDEAETSESSYFLHHSDENLRAYFASTEVIPEDLENLKRLVSDNPPQEAKAVELESMVDHRLDTMAGLLARARAGINNRLHQALDLQSSLDIRKHLSSMESAERVLLKIREQRKENNLRLINTFMLLSTLVALGMIGFGIFVMRRSLRAKNNQNRFMSSVFDCVSGGLMVTDPEGNTTHFNRAAREMIGIDLMQATAEERVKWGGFTNVETGKPLKPEESSVVRALKGESVNGFEISVVLRGESRIISVDARPILDVDNQIVGSIALFHDVTEQKSIQIHSLQAREAALEASRLKSEFLANMSHEIRTPMNGVLGMATLLLDTKMTDDQQQHVKTIKNSADSLLSLINQILDHSKIEAGKLELASADFNLHECVQSVISMFTYLSRSKNVELKLSMSPATPEFMRGDQARLRQVLVNLVGNALKFTEKGFVNLEVEPILCSNSIHKILFEVKDSGPGIPKAAQAELFGRFSQTAQTKFARGSSGLGLTISRELVSLMKGEIGFDSLEGVGSRFWFTAEFGLAEKVVHEPLSRAHVRRTFTGHILIAEDQLVNQTVIRKFLELFGVTCEIVGNGALAFDAFKRSHFDMIFMDCQMPDMDGYEATEAIREFEKTLSERRHIPIVALTAEGRSGDRERCFKVGMDDFLTKPIEIDRLQTVLEQRLTKKDANSVFQKSTLEKLDGFESQGRPLSEVLIGDYLDSTPELIRKMQIAEKEQDFDSLAAYAHALRSSSLTLGLETVGKLCTEIEDNPSGTSRVVPLREAWSEGCSQLKAFLNSRTSQVA